MFFHVNATMPRQKSGIEHAELKRFKLLTAHGVDSRVVLRDWDPNVHTNANDAGISDDQLINMFDYFQEAHSTPGCPFPRDSLAKRLLISYWKKPQ